MAAESFSKITHMIFNKGKYFLLLLFITISCRNKNTIYFEMGIRATNQGDYKNAMKNFSNAIQLDSLNLDAYYFRGKVHRELNQDSLAIKDFSFVINHNASYKYSYTNRGNLIWL